MNSSAQFGTIPSVTIDDTLDQIEEDETEEIEIEVEPQGEILSKSRVPSEVEGRAASRRAPLVRPHRLLPITPLKRQTEQTPQTQAAHQAPRCAHLRASGVRCGSPALRGSAFCYYHDHFHNGPRIIFPSLAKLDDAYGIQTALAEVLTGILDGRLNHKTAGLLLYGLQTAVANLKHMPDLDPDDVVTDIPQPDPELHLDPVDRDDAEPRYDPLDADQDAIAAEKAAAAQAAGAAIEHLAQHHRFAGSRPTGNPAADGRRAETMASYFRHTPDQPHRDDSAGRSGPSALTSSAARTKHVSAGFRAHNSAESQSDDTAASPELATAQVARDGSPPELRAES